MDRLDTEDRMIRALDSLEAVVDLCGGQSSGNAVNSGRMAALLNLIHSEMSEALPRALSRRLGDNDED